MATDKKITELTAATTPLGGTEKAEIVQGGVNKQVDVSEFGVGNFLPLTLTAPASVNINGNILNIGNATDYVEVDPAGGVSVMTGAGNVLSLQSDAVSLNMNANLSIVSNGQVNITTQNGDDVHLDSSGHMELEMVGDLKINTDPGASGQVLTSNGIGVPPTWEDAAAGGGAWGSITGTLSSQTDLQSALDAKVDEETFTTLTFASPTVWACNSRQMPLAKVTATGDFTIDMTNVKSGSQGILKVTASTASAFTITFDTDFTNVEATTNASLLTYTFPADNGQFYLLNFVCDGTILHWTILDVQTENPIPFAQIGRATSQSINNNDSTVFVSFDTETHDNSSIWAVSPNPTRFTIPGSGSKVATVSIRSQWASNSTGVRRNVPYLNGSTTGDIHERTSSGTSITQSTHQIACSGGDYIEILAYQNSGGALNLDVCSVRIQIHDR